MKRVVFFAVLALCCLLLAGCAGARGGLLGTSFEYEDANSYAVGGAVMAEDVDRVEIQWLAGSVELAMGDGDRVELEESAGRALPEDLRMRWRLRDGTLKIMFCNSGRWDLSGLDKALTVRLPRGRALESVAVTTVSADILAPELSARGIDWHTASGAVRAQLAGAEELRVRTISGAVNLASDADAAQVNVDSTSGAIRLDLGKVGVLDAVTISGGIDLSAGSIGRMDAGTTSGGVSLRLKEMGGACEIRTISGGVTLTLPAEAGFSMDFSTVSGRLDSEVELRRENGAYIAGDGSQLFGIHTTSGNVKVLSE